ncbi:MAG: hypothetical protein QXU18_14530 [Thermoplasmatales archaeon]
MPKYIGKSGNKIILGGLGQAFRLRIPYLSQYIFFKRGVARANAYMKHREWTHNDTDRTLNELKDEENQRKR